LLKLKLFKWFLKAKKQVGWFLCFTVLAVLAAHFMKEVTVHDKEKYCVLLSLRMLSYLHISDEIEA